MKELNDVKDEIQRQAHAIWLATGRKGTIAAGTGSGKSRIAILEIERMLETGILDKNDPEDTKSVLLVTPTELLRDKNWPKEFEDWNASELYSNFVNPICFKSLYKEQGNRYKLVILDEAHWITELSFRGMVSKNVDENDLSDFFVRNTADACLALTATAPDADEEPDKFLLLSQVAPVVFLYPLDQGVDDGIIADYEIHVILTELDSNTKNIKAGTKAKPFYTTEVKQYEFLEKQILQSRFSLAKAKTLEEKEKYDQLVSIRTFQRNRFIYNLPSKTLLAQKWINSMCAQLRTLVFCGSIKQCNELLGKDVYHSESNDDAFIRFNQKLISKLGVVDAANEGINFVDLDQSLLVQISKKIRKMVQRAGRTLRERLNHKGKIWIICARGTADHRWLNNALKCFDQSKIRYYSEKEFLEIAANSTNN